MSKKHKFLVSVTKTVEVEFNDSVMPDDAWRRQFYSSIRTPADLAEHLAFNYTANGVEKISELDGFVTTPDRFVKFYDRGWDTESDEMRK